MAVLIFVAPPIMGFLLGLIVKRWRVATACALVVIAASLSGWAFGWTGDSETPALGGAILFATFFGVPFVGGACLGVWVARTSARRGRHGDPLVDVRLGLPPGQRGSS